MHFIILPVPLSPTQTRPMVNIQNVDGGIWHNYHQCNAVFNTVKRHMYKSTITKIYTYIFVPLRGMHPPHPPTAISECCIYVTKSQNLELNNSNVVCGFIFPYLHVICSCINKNDNGRPFNEGDIISVTAMPFRWRPIFNLQVSVGVLWWRRHHFSPPHH